MNRVLVSLLCCFLLVWCHEGHSHEHSHDEDCVDRGDHNEDFAGYHQEVRVYDITGNQEETSNAVEDWFAEVLHGDEIIEMSVLLTGETDDPKLTFISTWRSKALAEQAVKRANDNAPFTDFLTEEEAYTGTILTFDHEDHTKNQTGFYKNVLIARFDGEYPDTFPSTFEDHFYPAIWQGAADFVSVAGHHQVGLGETPGDFWIVVDTWKTATGMSGGASDYSNYINDNSTDLSDLVGHHFGHIVTHYISEPMECSSSSLLPVTLLALFMLFASL